MSAPRKNRMIFMAAAGFLLAAFGVSLCVGRYPLTLSDIAAALSGAEGMAAQVFYRLRLPRSLAAMAAGMAMGLSGAVYQMVFANPLAAPDIMGVSGGATLGAAVAIVLLGGSFVCTGAFVGGMAALVLSLLLTRASGSRGTASIVLSGILLSALAKTGIMLLKLMADSEGELAAIEFFTMGSFAAVTAGTLPSLLSSIGLGMLVLLALGRQLMLLTLSDEEAASLGVPVFAVRTAVLCAATLMACAVSAHAGVIAFSALIAPHTARLLLSGRVKGLAMLSVLCGGVLMLLSDICARLLPGAELPTSVFTTVLGAAMIVSLMVKGGRSDG